MRFISLGKGRHRSSHGERGVGRICPPAIPENIVTNIRYQLPDNISCCAGSGSAASTPDVRTTADLTTDRPQIHITDIKSAIYCLKYPTFAI